MAIRDKTIYSNTGGAFLKPFSVGSSIHWYVHVDEFVYRYGDRKGKKGVQISGQVRLTDCEDNIDWTISSDDDIFKLERAILQLQQAKEALIMARSVYKQHRKKLGIKKDEDDDD